jgi:hypothetical protein
MSQLLAIIVVVVLTSSVTMADQAQTCDGHNYTIRDGLNLICSATWSSTGTCTGRDMWADWKVAGGTAASPDSFVRPWLDVPIAIVGYELTKLSGDTWRPWEMYHNWMRSWFMVGSTIQPDAMLWLGPGQAHNKQIWPAGSGQWWPAKSEAVPTKPVNDSSGNVIGVNGDLLDLHGQCYGGMNMKIFLTIYYSPQSK